MAIDRTAAAAARLIRDMHERRPGEPQHRRFLRLCELVAQTYEPCGGDLNAIRDSAITPVLAAYVAVAFTEYAQQESSCQTTEDRAGAIASALRMTTRSKRGAIVRSWPEETEIKCYTAFAFECYEARDEELPDYKIYERGMTAAYQALRQGRGDQSGTQRKVTKAKLRALMAQHGHHEPEEAKLRREQAASPSR